MEKKRIKGLNKSLKLLVRTSFIVFAGVLLSKIFTYVYKIVIARAFGPEAYGLFSLAVMISGLFIAFASFGLIEGITRYIPLYNGKGKHDFSRYMFRAVFIMLVISSIIFGIILFLLADVISIDVFHNWELGAYLKIFGLLVPISVLSSLYLAALRASEKVGLYSFIVNIFQSFVKLALLLLLVFIGIKSNAIPISYLLGVLFMLILSYIVSRYYVNDLFRKTSIGSSEKGKIMSSLFHYSWPIIFLGLIGSLFYWIDSLVIGYLRNATDVGFYNAAFSIVGLFGIAPEIFMQLFFPLIVREYAKKNLSLIEQTSKQVSKWIFLINLPVFIVIFIFPGTIINILFGSQYLAAESALRILAIGGLLSSLMMLGSNILSMEGRSKIILSNLLIASLVNLVLDIILVQKYGMVGAAAATSFVWVALCIVVFIEVKKYTSMIPLRRRMLRIAIVSIIPTVLLIIVKQYVSINLLSMAILGLLFVLVYVLLIFVTGCLDRNDLMIINAIKSKFGLIRGEDRAVSPGTD